MNQNLIGIEIGGTKLQIVSGDPAGTIHRRERLAVDGSAGADGIRAQIEAGLHSIGAATNARAIGVGYGGPVDWRSGQVRCSHHVDGWADFALREWLSDLAGLPVRVDNDANVAALAEAYSGAGQDHNPVFYTTLGSGVGGGLVVDGRIYHGRTPGEAEIGHVRLNREGDTVESRCSGWAVDRRIRDACSERPPGRLAELAAASPGNEARHLRGALAEGDPVALRILEETAEDLAFGLSHVVHLTHPEILILGGGLSLVGEALRRAVAGALPQFLMDAMKPGPRVALAALREDAVPVGALLLAAGAD